MDENVLVADGWLDEPITLGRVEPLDGTLRHRLSPGLDAKKTRPRFPRATPQTAFPQSAQIQNLEFQNREMHSRTATIRLWPRLQHEICALARLRPAAPNRRYTAATCGGRTTMRGIR